MYIHPSLWITLIALAFLAGMVFQAIRESLRPIVTDDDKPEQNGYVPAADEPERL